MLSTVRSDEFADIFDDYSELLSGILGTEDMEIPDFELIAGDVDEDPLVESRPRTLPAPSQAVVSKQQGAIQKRSKGSAKAGKRTSRRGPRKPSELPKATLSRPCTCENAPLWLKPHNPSYVRSSLLTFRSPDPAGCRAARVLCNRGWPCSRCERLGLECTVPKTVRRGRPTTAMVLERETLRKQEEAESSGDEATSTNGSIPGTP